MAFKKNIEIQSLRGYAIILTIIAHFGTLLPQLNPYLSYFWLGGGVDLFFCISGFVIARGLLEKKTENFFAFALPFLIRRMFRLWPAAIFWSLVVLALSLLFNSSGAFSSFENNFITAISGWFQVVNFKIVSCAYFKFSECSAGSPLRLYWSLSLEEQFYLIFPTLLFFLGKRRIAILAFAVFLIQFFLYRPWPSPFWFFRTDAICLGILIAWFHYQGLSNIVNPTHLEKTSLRTLSSILLCSLLFMVAKIEVVWFFNGLVTLVAGALVYIASFDSGYFLRNALVLRVSAFIGERSYSMYLTHMICLVLVKELSFRFIGSIPKEGLWPIYLSIIAWIFIFLLSEVSYRFIEQPLRIYGRRLAERKSIEILSLHKD